MIQYKALSENKTIKTVSFPSGQILGQPTLPNKYIPQVGWSIACPGCQPGRLSEELESRARAHWAPEDKERRRLRQVGGTLPASVVARGHWISASHRHLRGVSQAAQPHQKLAARRPQLPNTSRGTSFPGLDFTHRTGTGHLGPNGGATLYRTAHQRPGRQTEMY